MSKFKINVIRTDEYEIEIDEKIWDEKAIQEWAKVFYEAESTEDIAKDLAGSIMKMGSDYGFMEGFGYVKTLRSDGSQKKHFGEGFKEIKKSEYTKGIVLKVLQEDEDYEYEIQPLK